VVVVGHHLEAEPCVFLRADIIIVLIEQLVAGSIAAAILFLIALSWFTLYSCLLGIINQTARRLRSHQMFFREFIEIVRAHLLLIVGTTVNFHLDHISLVLFYR
jgi:hypothetical protein